MDRSQDREQSGREGATPGKTVEKRTCDRCGQVGHLRRNYPNTLKPKTSGEAAPVVKPEPSGKRIASTVVDNQARARTAASDGVLPFATTEHRTWNAFCTTCKNLHQTEAQCWEGNKDRRPNNYRAKAARVTWEDQQSDAAAHAARAAKEDGYRRYTMEQGPSEQGDIYDQAPRRTWMAHACFQTVVEEEEIFGFLLDQHDLVEPLAVEPVSPRRSPRLRLDNSPRQPPSPRHRQTPPPSTPSKSQRRG